MVLPDRGQHAVPIAEWSPAVDDSSRETGHRLALTAALGALPAEYRTAVVLHDVEGLSNREVAETLNLSVANVKTRVHRARLFLRKHLAAYMATSRLSVFVAASAVRGTGPGGSSGSERAVPAPTAASVTHAGRAASKRGEEQSA
jgi:Sigma-70, region 4